MNNPPIIFPLGDSAATIQLGETISEELNQKVLAIREWFGKNPFAGLQDVIVAYSSFTIVYDPFKIRKHHAVNSTVFEWIEKKLQQAYEEAVIPEDSTRTITRIPVCYEEEFGIDLNDVCNATSLSKEEIIELHLSKNYRVFMLGFLPGFAYMGRLEQRLKLPRKEIPMAVTAGSVGIVSNQTGIYPLNSPGGWHIIGRTPLKMFDAKETVPVKLTPGDEVQFYQITRTEFDKMA
ncbi:MAG: 5-oxoprolinase subunit PxpB [Flavitalea sp.]